MAIAVRPPRSRYFWILPVAVLGSPRDNGEKIGHFEVAHVRNGLVAAELSLATMLLVGAGLLMQSLSRLEKVHLGFRPEGILSFQLASPAVRYPDSIKRWAFFRDVLQSLSAIPGVTGAAMSSGIPMGQGSYNRSPFMPTGSSILPAGTAVPIDWRVASPGYFRLMGIPLLDGRDFSEQDGPKATDVIILSRSAARKFWGDENPIGKMVHRPTANSSYTVIGVVGEVRHTSLNQEFPCLYFSAATRTAPLMDMVIRTQGRPDSVLSAARKPPSSLCFVALSRSVEETTGGSESLGPDLIVQLVPRFAVLGPVRRCQRTEHVASRSLY